MLQWNFRVAVLSAALAAIAALGGWYDWVYFGW